MLTPQDLQKLYTEHQTSAQGLTESQVSTQHQKYGLNAIVVKKKKPLILVFLEEFKDLMVIILIIAAALALIAGETTDGVVILFVVVLNAMIGFVQKFKAEKAVEALQKLVAPHARVIRNGQEEEIEAKQVVPGDILILAEGNSVAADAILIEANELTTQESALTGESTPVGKHTQDHQDQEILKAHKENMVFMGTNIAHGSGKAIVVHTGMATQMGNIAKLTSETKKDKSPLEKELFRIGLFVGKIALAISAVLLGVGVFIQGKEFVETLLFASSVAVAAVPEGLPATITIALAIGVQRLAKKNAIVKQLSASETLGSTTVICSDKTGTLTKNEMTVKELYFNDHEAAVHGVGYTPNGYINIQKDGKNLITIGKENQPYENYEITQHDLQEVEQKEPQLFKALKLFMATAALCNNATLTNKNNTWSILGDPTEGALQTLSHKCGFTHQNLEQEFQRVSEISFDSSRKRMTVIVKSKNNRYFALTKGAPASIIDIATTCLEAGETTTFSEEKKAHFKQKNEAMAKRALRVLALGYRELTAEEITKLKKEGHLAQKETERELTFLGLVGMIDPPRPEVKEAVELAKQAHLRIYIITGDHGLTAEAIAKQLNIITSKREHRIITGVELNSIKDEELKTLLSNKNLDIIFARVSPEHKLRIVKMLKKLKEIVAVTGDGVNDAPALKKADIGVAMGIAGTDVSKEAANMVLADDSFSSIITAIKEGRTIYNNLKKFVFYMFSCNIGELFTVFAAIILFLPAPLTAILILAVNIGTDILPALALGVDPAEPGIMQKKPRHSDEKIMNRSFVGRYAYIGIIIGIVVMVIYIWTLFRYGWTWGEPLSRDNLIYLKGSTTAFALLIVIQMAQAFNARSDRHSIFQLGLFSNLYLFGAIGISLILTFIMVEVPFLQTYLHTTSLNLEDWGIIVVASMTVIIVEEIRKVWLRAKARLQ